MWDLAFSLVEKALTSVNGVEPAVFVVTMYTEVGMVVVLAIGLE